MYLLNQTKMENNLRELFEELQNIINIEPGRDGSKIGML